MTRINVGIPPKQLSRQHLIAEHREIKRIPNAVNSGTANLGNLPTSFTLGSGHVRFFYNKLGYLLKRYKEIYQECLERGYNVQNYEGAWYGIPDCLMQDWEPSDSDIMQLKKRLLEKDPEYYVGFGWFGWAA